MTLAFLRFALASLFLAPFFIAQSKKSIPSGKQVKIDKKDIPKLIAVGVLIISLNITFFFEGIRRTTAIDASVLTLIIPILSVLLGWRFLREKIYPINIVGMTFAFLGALAILGITQIFTGPESVQILIGNVLIILSSICWVFGALIAKKLLNKYSSLVVTAIAFLVGTTTFFIPAANEYIQNPSWTAQITILGILGLSYMTILSSISAYYLFEWGLSKTSVATADLLQYIEPVVATLLAVAILGEKTSLSFFIGAGLIGIGAYLATLSKEAHHRRHKIHRN